MAPEDTEKARIHQRIDETHKMISEVKLSYATQTQNMINLSEDVKAFILKIDGLILHPQDGCMAKGKARVSSIFTQLKAQWFLIGIILVGIIGIAWEVIKKHA